jgi:hypothetical protein
VLAERLQSTHPVTFASTCAICAKAVQPSPWQRSMSNPVSLVALSVQARSIRLALTAVAFNSVGAAGGAGVVVQAVFENAE